MTDLARSREGRGLSVRGGDSDKWIMIQKNTFMNWVNLQLQGSGHVVDDFEVDFDNGVKLCALIEALQHRKIGKVIKKPLNQHQSLENVSLALKAVADDNVRLVNIGSEDIVNGSLKLILGLVWTLILRYQIGKTKFPAKKLMLAWLKAVVPDCRISNFTSDWNDGVALSALIDYCQPGLFPDWRSLSRHNSLDNCTSAMKVAREQLNIPMIVRPEDLASPHLDELSGMTYLSYYMMQDSPGYFATRREIRRILQAGSIDNFTTDWNDGQLLSNLVMSVGGDIPGWPNLSSDPVTNLQKGLDEGQRLGVEPIFSASEMADPEVEHLGIMAYAAYYARLTPVKLKWNPASLDANLNTAYVHRQQTFQVHLEDGSADSISAKVIGPDSNPPVSMEWSGSTATCSFTPTETGQHKLDVQSGATSIAGSPVQFRVLADRSQVSFLPPGRACVGTLTDMKVDVSSAGEGNVQMEARSPSGYTKDISPLYRPGVFDASFTPTEVGIWSISVLYDGDHIDGSPFPLSVYDPSLVRVSGLEGGAVGQSLAFTADASEAGEGEIGVGVYHEGTEVPSSISSDGQGRYSVDFMPGGAGLHTVYVTMNDQQVKDSPFTVDVVDSSLVTLSGDGISLVPVHQPATFTIHTKGAGNGKLNVDIAGPDRESMTFDQTTNADGDVEVTYTPTQVGDHMISVHCLGREVNGSPFLAKAYDTSAITVTPLEDGFVGQQMSFIINVTAAGEGQLQIMVNDGNLANDVDSQETGVYLISFLPVEPGLQKVDILFNDDTLAVSPLTCNAMAMDGEVSGMPDLVAVDQETSFTMRSAGGMAALADVTVMSPSGEQLDSTLAQNTDGDYRVEWTPKQPGRHSVDVLFGGQRVSGSPFYIEVFDVSRIRVDSFFNGNVGDEAGFSVDTSEAGVCDQSVRVVSPSGDNVPVSVSETSAGCYSVTYLPTEGGPHNIFLTYNNVQLPACPFSQEIGEAALPPVFGDGLFRGEEDCPAVFTIDAQGIRGEPTVQVDGPNSMAKCSVDPQADGQYTVTYVPVEVGMYDVQVMWNGKELPGSPYHPRVLCGRKVQVVGGWQHYMDDKERVHLVVGKEKELPFDVSQAGPGKMTAEVKGPSGLIPVSIDDSQVGRSTLAFTPEVEGDHHIHIFWSEVALPNAPIPGYAVPGMQDPCKVILTGRGLKEATVHEEAEFTIDASQAGAGEPGVQLTGVRAEAKVVVMPLGGGKFRCTYIPVVPGAYLLHITWNNRQLHGSPFKVNVIGAFYPNKVMVSGSGLNGGLLGQDLDVRIDTRKAGPGELTAYCMGQSKVAVCELEDFNDGTFRLIVRPQEVGQHMLQVKYGGEHVQNSPFAFKVGSLPDASKVRVSGPGVEHGILATYQSRFMVETRGAGAGQLTVRVRGPKGAFQVEMYRDSQKDRTILCRYDPSETGLYIVSVRWSGTDVPGSPFHIHILDTQAELEHVLNEQSFQGAAFNTTRVGSGYGGKWN
ncbi:filamin-C-like isoform X1 [Babylonia areolata]|uniref:filamin-C-like isoform X1 n=1 Tax=Babylonia areolata TaxID=304850 RepID=UPI003FD57BB7